MKKPPTPPSDCAPLPASEADADTVRALFDLGGAGVVVSEIGENLSPPLSGAARIAVHREGPLPTSGLDDFDCLLCAKPDAPAPWLGGSTGEMEAHIAAAVEAGAANPIAASVLAQVLRIGQGLDFESALLVESLAYSALLGGGEFRRWRSGRSGGASRPEPAERVRVHLDGDRLRVTLCRPARRNAFDAAMRDALADALLTGLDMGPTTEVVLGGEGPSFSAGGDLDEFGAARDLALAHTIRMQRSPAALARRLGSRLTVVVHGACIGAGIEIPAAAARVVARGETFFRLPEVAMGLIPGAGGTASIPRRIGRHRTFFMALCGRDIDARTALDWGLIDELA